MGGGVVSGFAGEGGGGLPLWRYVPNAKLLYLF